MALHFSKYVGRLFESDSDDERTVVDVFVIAMSSANVLGLHLPPATGCRQLSRKEFVEALAIASGKMAAACEKMDHLEAFPFRQTMQQSVNDIAVAVQSFAQSTDLALAESVRSRLRGVRDKAFVPGKLA
jgi:hypothetical protein